MAKKTKSVAEEYVSFTAEAVKTVSFVDYFTKSPLFTTVQVKNGSSESVNDLTLTLWDENGLTIKTVRQIPELPYESTVEADSSCM